MILYVLYDVRKCILSVTNKRLMGSEVLLLLSCFPTRNRGRTMVYLTRPHLYQCSCCFSKQGGHWSESTAVVTLTEWYNPTTLISAVLMLLLCRSLTDQWRRLHQMNQSDQDNSPGLIGSSTSLQIIDWLLDPCVTASCGFSSDVAERVFRTDLVLHVQPQER